jgi:curved DNA-binding protein CbpA
VRSVGKFDPYETLGVDRDATDAQIKRAAKDKAKTAHPDKGGTAEDFQANRRALAILMDPTKRKRFDQTGEADEPKPDNAAAQAMEAIYHEISEVTNAYLMSGFAAEKDPRRINLIAKVEASIINHIAKGEELLRGGVQHARFLRDFRSRFSRKAPKGSANEAFDFIARKIDDEIVAVEAKSEQLKEMIAGARLSLELIRTYDFRFDPPAEPETVYDPYVAGGFHGYTRRY